VINFGLAYLVFIEGIREIVLCDYIIRCSQLRSVQ